jgi:hypothetical protein
MNSRVARIRETKVEKKRLILQVIVIVSLFLLIFYASSINNTSSEFKDQSENIANTFKASDNFNQ